MGNYREIRHYQLGDERTIVDICNSAFGANPPFFHRTEESWLWRYVIRPGFDSESVLIAEEDGQAVSSLVMTYAKIRINEISRKVALIDDVATLPKYRGRGHATALVERSLEISREKECYAVHLTANPKGSAIRIYEKLGFNNIADLNLMESILHIYDLSKAMGLRYYIPLLFLNGWMRLREKPGGNIETNIVTGSDLGQALLLNQKNHSSHNGFVLMDKEYIDWMTGQRPVGDIVGVTAIINDDQVGMVSISAHEMETKTNTFLVGNIGNLIISDKFWTQEILSELIQTARQVAKDTLGCAIASVVVDSRDKVLHNACKYSRFHPLSHGTSMIHPLENPDRLFEIKNQLWAQPLETLVADP